MWMWYFKKSNWLKLFYPELLNLPDDVRTQILHESAIRHRSSKPHWINVAGCLLAVGLSIYFFEVYYPTITFADRLFQACFQVLLALGIVYWSFKFDIRIQKRWLHAELNRLNLRPQQCLRCGYNLRGTPDDATTCSECGHDIARVTNAVASPVSTDAE